MDHPPIIIHLQDGKVPLPEAWTLERAVEVLRETHHSILRIEAQGQDIPVPGKEEAA